MIKSVPYWQVGGFLFAGIAGTLLHFLFDWTGGGAVAALFSAVNESVWEHMKLLYYPMVIFTVVEYFAWGKEMENFWCMKLLGLLLGLSLIPVLYYTYTGLLGVNADWFNIAIFFISAAVAFYVETKLFQRGFSCALCRKASIAIIVLLGVLFVVFTFLPPHIPFFQDPQNGSFGF